MPGDFLKAGVQRSTVDADQPNGPIQVRLPGDVYNRLEIHLDGEIWAGDGATPPSPVSTGGAVSSVNGQVGHVQLDAEDIPVADFTFTDVQGGFESFINDFAVLASVAQAAMTAANEADDTADAAQGTANTALADAAAAQATANAALPASSVALFTIKDADESYTRRGLRFINGTGITCEIADDAGGDEVEVTVSATGGGGGGLLAITEYNPATQQNITTTSATFADLDATNLAVTFTVPASGRVLVRLQAYAIGAASSGLGWGVREGTTTVAFSNIVFGALDEKQHLDLLVTGLTPAASLTYKFAHARTAGAGTVATRYGRATNDQAGPASIQIWAAP